MNSELRVKKKNHILFGGLLLALALVLTSCLFDSDANGVDYWLSDHGMPNSYKVQKVEVNGINLASSKVFLDTLPTSTGSLFSVGQYANIVHDAVFDFGFFPSEELLKGLNSSDTAGAYILLYWNRNFYRAKEFPKDSLPIKESVNFSFSWIMDVCYGSKALDSLKQISDATWLQTLNWKKSASVDTTLDVSVGAKDSTIRLEIPTAIVDSIKKVSGGLVRLQLRLSAPDADHAFRFYGAPTYFPPTFFVYADSSNYLYQPAYRVANVVKNLEECAECPILHGGVFDSLEVEVPSEPIMKALSDFFGEEFPFREGNGNDVRQTVIHAELTMARDDSKGLSELGLPIQVVVGSYVDSASSVVRRMESYRVNKEIVGSSGHPNLVFHEGDSLTLQVTMGMKEFINKASEKESMKFIMRLGYPFLQEKDTSYATYVNDKGDTNYVFFGFFDHARYDFSTAMENPVSLKLWLASKRGDEE